MLLTPVHTEGQETAAAKRALVYTAFTFVHEAECPPLFSRTGLTYTLPAVMTEQQPSGSSVWVTAALLQEPARQIRRMPLSGNDDHNNKKTALPVQRGFRRSCP